MNKVWKCFVLLLCVCLALSPTNAYACTGIYAGSGTTANGSVYVGRSEDYGPDYVKQYRIVPAADHDAGEMFEDDYGFSVPYPAHTLRYSVLMDDPSRYSKTAIPYGEAGINEKGVSVSATVTTNFNKKVWEKDPLTIGGMTEISMASYVLQSAGSAQDEEIITLAKSGSAEEVSAMADRLADENADFAKRIAKEKLTEIDKDVAGYMCRLTAKWFISLF